ncbi:hypothetical protein OROGR_021167 [Orobanche gracilis]
MVGAPISYSGHPGTNQQTQAYATPSAPLSTLLPYGGRGPEGSGTYPGGPPASSAPLNTSYLYPPTNPSHPFPPPSSAPYPMTSTAPPPPFPPCSTTQANTMYNPNLANTYPPTSNSPFPAVANYPPNPAPPPYSAQPSAAYPPAGYPPQPNNPQAPPSGYPTGMQPCEYVDSGFISRTSRAPIKSQPTGNYTPATYAQVNPTSQASSYSAGNYVMPPPNAGVYPPRY